MKVIATKDYIAKQDHGLTEDNKLQIKRLRVYNANRLAIKEHEYRIFTNEYYNLYSRNSTYAFFYENEFNEVFRIIEE